MSVRFGEIKVIPLKTLTEVPGPYCMSFGFDLSAMVRSIEQVGLVNPPLVEEGRGQDPLIICGYKRILALKSLGAKDCPVRVLDAEGISPADALLTSLLDNLATRRLNVVEKAMALSRLSAFFTRAEILERFMPALDLPRREETLALHMVIDRDLDTDMKRSLVLQRVAVKSMGLLQNLKFDEIKGFFSLFEKVSFNPNQQAEVITLVEDLSRAQRTSADAILGCERVTEILFDTRLNGPQKANTLLGTLRAMRFPRLMEAEREFKARVSGLGLPQGIKILRPPFFEDRNYRMEILFENGRELEDKLDRVRRTPRLETLGNPWQGGD